MQPWTQLYDPAGNLALSAFIAALPIIFFFLALAVFRMKGHVAGVITVAIATGVGILFYGMPASAAVGAIIYGFLYGLWPIAWIIIGAVFLYKITVKSGQFEIIRASVVSITEDQRLQLLMVGFSFGAFLEGAAGFGAPVAITAALLTGLGFNPLYAAGLCLIANTAPVAFGGMGIPMIVAGKVTGIDPFKIGQMAGRQLPILSVIVPFWIIGIMDGWKGIKETWPAILVAGGSFAISVFFTSNFIGPELPDITSALISLTSLAVFLKFWQPKRIFRFTEITQAERDSARYTGAQIFKAWSPFLVLTAVVVVWSLPAFKALFGAGGALAGSIVKFPIGLVDKLVLKAAPIVTTPTPMPAVFELNLISATGTAILISAVISIVMLRVNGGVAVKTFVETLNELKRPIFTIGSVLAFAFIANFSGLSSTLALVLAGTGAAFPFFSPILGWMGVFLTGSDTSSNALFCGLQATTAQQVGVSDVLMVTTNTTGGVTGKMISPQSIAVATAAVGLVGQESNLFRFTVVHSIIFVCFIGALTCLYAYVTPWIIP